MFNRSTDSNGSSESLRSNDPAPESASHVAKSTDANTISPQVPGGALLRMAALARQQPIDYDKFLPLQLLSGLKDDQLIAAIRGRQIRSVVQLLSSRFPSLVVHEAHGDLWVPKKPFNVIRATLCSREALLSELPIAELDGVPTPPERIALSTIINIHSDMDTSAITVDGFRSPNTFKRAADNYLVRCGEEIYVTGPQYQRFLDCHPELMEPGRSAESYKKSALRTAPNGPYKIRLFDGVRRGTRDLRSLSFELQRAGYQYPDDASSLTKLVKGLEVNSPNLEVFRYFGTLWVGAKACASILQALPSANGHPCSSGPIFVKLNKTWQDKGWVDAREVMCLDDDLDQGFEMSSKARASSYPAFCVLRDPKNRCWVTEGTRNSLLSKNTNPPPKISSESRNESSQRGSNLHPGLIRRLVGLCLKKNPVKAKPPILQPYTDCIDELDTEAGFAKLGSELSAVMGDSTQRESLIEGFSQKIIEQGATRNSPKGLVGSDAKYLRQYLEDLVAGYNRSLRNR